MPKPITDQFSHLPISRQRRYQLRKDAQGLCIICGQPQSARGLCLAHAIYARERQRERIGCKTRHPNAMTYKIERRLELNK